MAHTSHRLPNGLIYLDIKWKTKEGSITPETAKSADFADFTIPGTDIKANINDYNSLSNWLNNTSSWIDKTLENTAKDKETIVNNIWTKHQKVPYTQFPRNIQESLTKLKKQGILTDIDSLTFEMARVLTVLDAANEFNKPTFSFAAVGAEYNIDRHNLSFKATIDDFPWNSGTKVRLTTGSYDLYATFTKHDTEIHFQVSNNYQEQAINLAEDFKPFQTVQLTKGV